MNNHTKLLLIAVILLMQTTLAQTRDRGADLKVPCYPHIDISTTGQWWMCNRCSHIWVADDMEGTWRTVLEPNDDFLVWTRGLCYHTDGRLWMTSCSGRNFENMVFSTDEGLTYATLKPPFVSAKDDEDGIQVLYMTNANEGFAGTNGLVEPYIYKNPTEDFSRSGLQKVTIETYYGGCFLYNKHSVTYTRSGDQLVESENTVDSSLHRPNRVPAGDIEQALLRLGENYNEMPSPEDFGLYGSTIDFKNLFYPGGCTSYAGYTVKLINRDGDTLKAKGYSSAECGDYFPWLLPMQISQRESSFTTYQPGLWKALRPLMPDGMNLLEHLNPMAFLKPGNLLFFSDTSGMSGAVRKSTGQYSHVAIVESVGDTVWIIDATPQHGVARRPFFHNPDEQLPFPDVYQFDGNIRINSVLDNARSFIGQPYDNAFLPNNKALYCSELIYECFLRDTRKGDRHLFKAKPMNWRDANGNIPEYWVAHFKELNMPIPEGVPGTNPTDLSRSPLLKKR